ncbi:Ascorbate-specific phosphotransferase enzyme IIA component [Planococcus massiliensis]|uniref:Ascorbate-specific PTS system EIIA component n=1 Tax=Planococcus massiliensis TaxID=1499687 RepID=A0A098EI05_9BACL|nr:PTS sugar transporter subunit IIA [Planococcus massiliensis]CEG21415.1 Ascorbate-specific phosphotransferase enzyme IIA component [Planococcus massiliensis]
MLEELVNTEDIELGLQTNDWEDAIRKSSRRLLEKGAIEQRYVESMIDVVKETGPYFVLGNHIALAHTRPENGATKLGMSFTTLNPPIEFGSENFDPIKLIITFSATDSKAHLLVMSELASILSDEEILEELFRSKTEEAFLSTLINALDE